MPPVAPIALVAPWWRHRARGAARYTPFAGLPAAQQAWRGARAVICRTHPSGELWPRSADCGVVILIIYDVRMILSLAFRLIADDKCIQKNTGVSKCRALSGVKRTCPFALQMSAFDPKRTWRAVQLPWLNIQVGLFQRTGLSRYDALS